MNKDTVLLTQWDKYQCGSITIMLSPRTISELKQVPKNYVKYDMVFNGLVIVCLVVILFKLFRHKHTILNTDRLNGKQTLI